MEHSGHNHGRGGPPLHSNGHRAQTQPTGGFEDDEISFHDVFETLLKGKWVILSTVIVVLAITAAYTYLKAPEYDASSLLYVNNQQSNPQLGEMLGIQADNRNIANEVEILKSRTISGRVASRLTQSGVVPGSGQPLSVLQRDDEQAAPLNAQQVAERLRRSYINIRPVSRDVDMIEIVATSTVPEEAALIADTYAEEFVQYNRNLSRSRMTASREFLTDVTDRFQTDLELAEEDLTAFLEQEQVVAPEEEARQLLEQVTGLQQLQYQTQHELGMAQAELSAIEQEFEQVVPGLAAKITSGDNIMIDALIQQISGLKVGIEQKYARNPALREDPSRDADLQEDLREIAALEADLQERADRLVADAVRSGGMTLGSSLGSPSDSEGRLSTLQQLRARMMEKQVMLSGLQARFDVITDQLDAAKTQLGRIPGQEIVLNRLERSLSTREQLYVALVEKLQEARIAEQSELGYVDIIDTALVPEIPVRPRKTLNLMLGLALGLAIGVAFAFTRNAFDNKIRKPEDLRREGLAVLTVIPSMNRHIKVAFDGRSLVEANGHEYSTSLLSLLDPLSYIAESYRRLAMNLQFSRPDRPVKSIVVTSAEAGDGKTVTALNLAIVFAQIGRRTVYVDADLRRPASHERLSIPKEPGLTDLVFSGSDFDPSHFTSAVDNLFVIPGGRSVPNPSEVVESRSFQNFLRDLEENFDMIVIDSPPVLAVADALSLTARADAALLVASAGKTTYPTLHRTLEELRHVRQKLTGGVLNRFDATAAYGSYRYGYSYGEANENNVSKSSHV